MGQRREGVATSPRRGLFLTVGSIIELSKVHESVELILKPISRCNFFSDTKYHNLSIMIEIEKDKTEKLGKKTTREGWVGLDKTQCLALGMAARFSHFEGVICSPSHQGPALLTWMARGSRGPPGRWCSRVRGAAMNGAIH